MRSFSGNGGAVQIATLDPAIVDVIISPAGLENFVRDNNFKHGERGILSQEQRNELVGELIGRSQILSPGGSAYLELATIRGLLGEQAEATFYTVKGKGGLTTMLENDARKVGMNMVSMQNKPGEAETAVSYIFDESERTMLTYPGNPRDVVDKAAITDEMVAGGNNKVFIVQASTANKLGTEIYEELVSKVWAAGNRMALSLPNSAFYAASEMGRLQHTISSADIVTGSQEVIASVFGVEPKDAAEALRKHFEQNKNERVKGEQVGFIFDGKKGGLIVTPDKIIPVQMNLPRDVEMLGLGVDNAANAGFIAGIIGGLEPKRAGELAAMMAEEMQKQWQSGVKRMPRVEDPQKVLRMRDSSMAIRITGNGRTSELQGSQFYVG